MLAGSLRRQKLSRREADGLERLLLLGPLLDILGGVGLSRSETQHAQAIKEFARYC